MPPTLKSSNQEQGGMTYFKGTAIIFDSTAGLPDTKLLTELVRRACPTGKLLTELVR